MHRIILLPRCLVATLVLGWLLTSGTGALHAQAPVAKKKLIIELYTTRTVETASKLPVMPGFGGLAISNPKVVDAVIGPKAPFNQVLITGLAPGISDVVITDTNKNTETYEVIVASDANRLMEEARKRFLATVKTAFPTANIDAIPSGTNTVLLTGTVPLAENVPPIIDIAKSYFGTTAVVINSMRLGGVQMVQIQVVVARVNRSEARNMSFNFLGTYTNAPNSFTLGNILRGSSLTNGATVASETAAAATQFAATGGNVPLSLIADRITATGFLEALRTEGLAKVSAEPTVTTLSGSPGSIVSGGKTPVLTTSGQGSPSITYQDFGTVVNFLPIVMGDGKIYMEVSSELSQLDAATSLFIAGVTQTAVPGFAKRNANVKVVLEDGQTLAIGGLIQNTVDSTMSKVPILGDLPFIGAAFRSVSSREVEEELLILVTPRLVHPMDCAQIPKYLPGKETRTPDDFELFLEGIMEAPRGPREVGLFGPASHLFGETAGVYPCGDSCDGARGHGFLTGCRGCQSVIHGAPVAPGAAEMPIEAAGHGRAALRKMPSALDPAPKTADTVSVSPPVVRDMPPPLTNVSSPEPSPSVNPGWLPPVPGAPEPLVPPVSELRKDLD